MKNTIRANHNSCKTPRSPQVKTPPNKPASLALADVKGRTYASEILINSEDFIHLVDQSRAARLNPGQQLAFLIHEKKEPVEKKVDLFELQCAYLQTNALTQLFADHIEHRSNGGHTILTDDRKENLAHGFAELTAISQSRLEKAYWAVHDGLVDKYIVDRRPAPMPVTEVAS